MFEKKAEEQNVNIKSKLRQLRKRALRAELRFLEELDQIAEDGGYGAVELDFDRPLTSEELDQFMRDGHSKVPVLAVVS